MTSFSEEYLITAIKFSTHFGGTALTNGMFRNHNTQLVVHRDKSTSIIHDGKYAYSEPDENGNSYQIGVVKMSNGKITNVNMFSDATPEYREYIAKNLTMAKSRSRSNK